MNQITPYQLAIQRRNEKLEMENNEKRKLYNYHLENINNFLTLLHDDLSNDKYPELSKEIYDYIITSGNPDLKYEIKSYTLNDKQTIWKYYDKTYYDSIDYIFSCNDYTKTLKIIKLTSTLYDFQIHLSYRYFFGRLFYINLIESEKKPKPNNKSCCIIS